jgi:phage tail protein X
MAIYKTIQDDPWDLISFKQYGNEYFSDQLIVANPTLNTIVNLDGNLQVQIPAIVTPVSVSPVIWGGLTAYS